MTNINKMTTKELIEGLKDYNTRDGLEKVLELQKTNIENQIADKELALAASQQELERIKLQKHDPKVAEVEHRRNLQYQLKMAKAQRDPTAVAAVSIVIAICTSLTIILGVMPGLYTFLENIIR